MIFFTYNISQKEDPMLNFSHFPCGAPLRLCVFHQREWYSLRLFGPKKYSRVVHPRVPSLDASRDHSNQHCACSSIREIVDFCLLTYNSPHTIIAIMAYYYYLASCNCKFTPFILTLFSHFQASGKLIHQFYYCLPCNTPREIFDGVLHGKQ